MATLNITLRTDKKPNDQGEYPLVLRLYHQKITYPYTFDFGVAKKFWNDNSKQIKRTNFYPNYGKKNHLIKTILQKAQDVVDRMLEIEPDIKPDYLRNIIAGELTDQQRIASVCYIKFLDGFIQEYVDNDQYSTSKLYEAHLTRITDYIDGDSLLFEDIDSHFIENYKNWLLNEKWNSVTKQKGLASSTVSNDIGYFSHTYSQAQKRFKHLRQDDPFFYVDVKVKEKPVVYLTTDEVQTIIDLDLERRTQIWAKDLFVFAIYSGGTRFGDCISLKWENVDLGKKQIEYIPQKTRNSNSGTVVCPLGKPAIEAIKKYSGDNEYVFPYANRYMERHNADLSDPKLFHKMSQSASVQVNKYLKQIADLADIDKRIHSHLAKHTFANILIKQGMSIDTICKMFSHSSVQVTKHYVAKFRQTDNTDQRDWLESNVAGW